MPKEQAKITAAEALDRRPCLLAQISHKLELRRQAVHWPLLYLHRSGRNRHMAKLAIIRLTRLRIWEIERLRLVLEEYAAPSEFCCPLILNVALASVGWPRHLVGPNVAGR